MSNKPELIREASRDNVEQNDYVKFLECQLAALNTEAENAVKDIRDIIATSQLSKQAQLNLIKNIVNGIKD